MQETNHMPPPGGGALGATDRFVARIENVFNMVAALVIFVMMFFMVAEVIGRTIFNRPIPGAIDWIETSMAAFAFLGVAYCQRLGGHIRMEVVMSRLHGVVLWTIEFAAAAIAAFYVFVIMNRSFFHFMRAYEIGDSTIDIQLPVWPSKLLVPLALGLLLIRLLIQLWGYARLIAHPDAQPIAVPILKDAADQAREEIEEALHEHPASPEGDRPGQRPGTPRNGGHR